MSSTIRRTIYLYTAIRLFVFLRLSIRESLRLTWKVFAARIPTKASAKINASAIVSQTRWCTFTRAVTQFARRHSRLCGKRAYVRRRRMKKEKSRRSGKGKWSEGNENGEHGERRPVVVRHRAIGGGATAHLPAGRGLSRCSPGWKSVRRFSCPS